MQKQVNLQQSWRNKFLTPLYSPRTTYSKHIKQVDLLKTNLAINIDKYILGSLKNQFEKRGNQISVIEFIYFCKKYLKDWNPKLYGREVKIDECLLDLVKQIDLDNKGKLTWEQFNSKIIQTSLNLKSLSNNSGIQSPVFKEIPVPVIKSKSENLVEKMVYINQKNKIAYFRQESITIDFFSTEFQNNDILPTKSIILPQQDLKVETTMKVKVKNNQNQKSTHSKLVKKDVKVSSYKNTVLDLIYVNDEKYNMLIVSCSDKIIRGYNVSGTVPFIASQPQNEDQLMTHQFPVEIYNMTWDSTHEVLYASGKNPTIYQWMIKTDSQRQINDHKGHLKMISNMIILTKLQLLATGGYDGKVILWDTVGQTVKNKYQEHTRAISSIAFHQDLVLLFTASFDHKICIWNPYISSLIHKIENNFNVINIQIIPETNYLIALDIGGNVKVREINKFTQITSFSIFRSENIQQNQIFNKYSSEKQKQCNICLCSKKDGGIHYYFATDKIMGYEYLQLQKSSIQGGIPLNMKYYYNKFLIYSPIKNHVLILNLLVGKIDEILYDMAESDITAFQLIQDLKIMIIGDTDGNVNLKKIDNGRFISKLFKFKNSVTQLKCYEIQRSQKQKHLKKTYILFCSTYEGDLTILKCQPKANFEVYRLISLGNNFGIPSGTNINQLEYLKSKNVLILGLNTNQILSIDIEKSTLMSKIEMGILNINGIQIINHNSINFLTVMSKQSQLTTFYLPPNPKKYKVSGFLQVDYINKIEYSLYGFRNQSFFICTQKNQILCWPLKKQFLLNQDNKSSKVSQQNQMYPLWKLNYTQKIKNMILIQNEQILVALTANGHFLFVSTNKGQIICQLKNDSEQYPSPQPIVYLKEQTSEIYIPSQDQYIQLPKNEVPQVQIRKIIDPNYFINFMKQKDIKNYTNKSNPIWNLRLNYENHFQKRIKEVNQVQQQMNRFQKELQNRGNIYTDNKLQKALQLQKKWQTQKQSEEGSTQKVLELSNKKSTRQSKNSLHVPQKLIRGSSLGSLWKYRSTHKNTQIKQEKKSHKKSHAQINTNFQNNQYSARVKNDPLYRLGIALQNVNSTDKKAQNFMKLALKKQKKQQIKFPKITKKNNF